MKKTSIHLHSKFIISPVDPRVFGGFLEHMGRAVYEGIYEPESALADSEGCRKDVLEVLKRLNMTAMRYPGGNFASGYHWTDGVGPAKKRPIVRELAWQSIESNQFGTDEFINLSRKMGWSPMVTVNLGTGTPEEARNWVEYCNCPPGTLYSNMRVANGNTKAHDVKLWCLGNEMDGEWQLGHVPADQYAIRAQQAAKMMKDADSRIELVACGSSGVQMESYMDWDREVLSYMHGVADYISLHRYVGNRNEDTPDYLAVTNSIDAQIEQIDSVCRFVQDKSRSKKRAFLCFDEWNVWYKNQETDGEGKKAPRLIEEVYNLEDALVVAGFLNSFIRHSDVVKIANLAQIVNVIAPVITSTDNVLIQSIFYPFEMMSKRRNGLSLQVSVEGPCYEGSENGQVNYIDSSAILNGEKLHVFLTNRSMAENSEVNLLVADLTIDVLESAEILSGTDPKATNSFNNPNRVAATAFEGIKVVNGHTHFEIPPLSFVAATFLLKR